MTPRQLARLLLATRALPPRAALFQARAMLRAAFPVDGRAVAGWLAAPRGSIVALSFLPSSRGANTSREFAPVRRVNRRRPSVDPRR